MQKKTGRNSLFVLAAICCLNVFLLVFWASKLDVFRIKDHAISMKLPSDKDNGEPFCYCANRLLRVLQSKETLRFTLYGNEDADDTTLQNIRHNASLIKIGCDSNTIIKIEFDDNMSYGRWIKLLDIMEYDLYKKWMFIENAFYLLPYEPKTCEPIYPHP